MDEVIRMFGGAENIWVAIQKDAEKVGIEVTRVMLELFYVLKSPETNIFDKTLIVAALAYQLLPEDAISKDSFGLLGFLDNGVTLAFAYNRVKSSVTPEIERQVNNVLANWFGVDSEASQNYLTSNESQIEGYTPQPQSIETPKNVTEPFLRGTTGSPSGQHPIWNEDDDVVID